MDNNLNNVYLAKMKELEQVQDDPEMVHSEADKILCEILTKLGYVELVNVFKNLHKYYA